VHAGKARLFCLLIVLVLTSFLTFWHADCYLAGTARHALWFDEGVNLSVSANMVRTGTYALSRPGGETDPFPAGVSTGPTVLLPIAAAFKLFGIGLVQGRIVTGTYLLLAVLFFFLVTDWLQGWKSAALACALFLTGAVANPLVRGFPYEPVTHARFVLGEVPGFFFLLLGVWLWGRALARLPYPHSNCLLFLAGLSWGLAIQTKMMYALILVAFVIWNALDRRVWRTLLFPVIGALLPGLPWLAYQALVLGPTILLQRNPLGWPNYAPEVAGLTLDLPTLIGRIGGMSSSGIVVFGIPALIGALVSVITTPKSPQRSVHGFLLILTIVWAGWFLFSALGRARHFLPAIFLLDIFFAKFLLDVGNGLTFPLSQTFKNWRSREFWTKHARTITVTLLIVLLLFNPTRWLFRQVIRDVEDSPQQVVSFLQQVGAQPSRVAASEREIDFLWGHPLHDLIWEGERLPEDIEYVICGSQAKQHIACPLPKWTGQTELVLSVGEYDVYHIQSVP